MEALGSPPPREANQFLKLAARVTQPPPSLRPGERLTTQFSVVQPVRKGGLRLTTLSAYCWPRTKCQREAKDKAILGSSW